MGGHLRHPGLPWGPFRWLASGCARRHVEAASAGDLLAAASDERGRALRDLSGYARRHVARAGGGASARVAARRLARRNREYQGGRRGTMAGPWSGPRHPRSEERTGGKEWV